MKQNYSGQEPKRRNKIRIAEFISAQGRTSKAEISAKLKLSMPTTLQYVKELTDDGIVVEEGEYESTGGRKARALSIARDAGFVVGTEITKNHITMAAVNTRKEIVQSRRIRLGYADTPAYYGKIRELLLEFAGETKPDKGKLIGVGFALPGIVDKEQKILIRSHTLKVQNISFQEFSPYAGCRLKIENDANSAAYAELNHRNENAVYLSLSNTVGGAVYLQNRLYGGENFKSGEFGHMVIEREGRPCYCGKKGCVDAYCSAEILQSITGNLEDFFELVRKEDKEALNLWEEYLEYLAITVTNLRMAFDCKIILGGYVGGYLEEFMPQLAEKVQKYNNFDSDVSYLSTGTYRLEAAAYGVTLGFINDFLREV